MSLCVVLGTAATRYFQYEFLLQELLGQLGHYSGKNRAAALAGLTDLLQRHPQELNRQVHMLFVGKFRYSSE